MGRRTYDFGVDGSRRRLTRAAVFALLTLVAELTGRSLTYRLDGAVHVEPLTTPMASSYPFLLAAVRLLAALALAGIAWRLVRAHGTAAAGEALLRRIGQRRVGAPRLRFRVTLGTWLASFGATAVWYLLQNDSERLSQGRWPLLDPWLHTFALPVFAVIAVAFALAWSIVRDWVAEVERYAAATFGRVVHALRSAASPRPRSTRSSDDRGPRHLFGVLFESRPPPVPA